METSISAILAFIRVAQNCGSPRSMTQCYHNGAQWSRDDTCWLWWPADPNFSRWLQYCVTIWLVVWNIVHFSIYWECSSQLTFIFFRGIETTNQFSIVSPVGQDSHFSLNPSGNPLRISNGTRTAPAYRDIRSLLVGLGSVFAISAVGGPSFGRTMYGSRVPNLWWFQVVVIFDRGQ
jgi:hypothetical protein